MVFVIFHAFHDSMIDDKASWIRNVSTFCLWCLRISKTIASPERTVVFVSRPGVHCKILEKRKTIKPVCDSLVLVCHLKESRSHFSKDVRAEIYGKLRPGVPVGAASWAQPEFKMFSYFFINDSKCIQHNKMHSKKQNVQKLFSRFEELPLDAKQLRARRILEGSNIRREASKNLWIADAVEKKNICLSRLSRVTWSLPGPCFQKKTCILLHSEILEHANTLLLECCCQASSPVPKLPVLGLQVWLSEKKEKNHWSDVLGVLGVDALGFVYKKSSWSERMWKLQNTCAVFECVSDCESISVFLGEL